jgi:hypothetical protein
MKRSFQLVCVLIAVGFDIGCSREEAKRSESAENAAETRRQAILAEIKALNAHEWAGEYYAGNGMGVNTSLAIAPKSGYVFEWHGCMGLYDRNYGAVTSAGGRIRLAFTFENKREGFQGIAPELVPISWGSRHYLIPADDIVGFCNNVNEGREPRNGSHGFYLLREEDEVKAVSGLPNVPREYESYLLAKPIEATIIAVGKHTTRPSLADWNFKDTPVTIDAGSQHGLRVGMELFVIEPRDGVDSIEITKVEQSRSEGVMSQAGEDEPGPEVGWRLSTRAPWNEDVAE